MEFSQYYYYYSSGALAHSGELSGTLGNSGELWGEGGGGGGNSWELWCTVGSSRELLLPSSSFLSSSSSPATPGKDYFPFLLLLPPSPLPSLLPLPFPPAPLKGLLPLPYPSSSFFFLPFFFLPLPSLRPPLRPKIEQGPQKRIPPPEGHRWRYQNAPKLRLKLIQDSSSVPKLIRNCPKFDLKMSKGPPKKTATKRLHS